MNRIVRNVFLALCLVVSAAVVTTIFAPPSHGQVAINVSFAPPALPVYDLPPCPGDGYLWTPGYWAYDDDDGYYWVPGTWVMAPEPGLLWTPAWWGWDNGGFIFHDGYWATDVGFYGGINYGFGYFGDGFVGGGWQGSVFRYNTAVLVVDTTVVHNVYVDRTVIVNHPEENHVSYNGGEGGISRRPTPQEEHAGQERHVPPPAEQRQHIDNARSNPDMRATQNQGKPAIAATPKPGQFNGHGVEQSKEAGAPYHPPANAPAGNGHQPPAQGEHAGQPAGAPANGSRNETGNTGNDSHAAPGNAPANGSDHAGGNPSGHAGDLQQHQPTPPNTGDPKLDQKYQQQQQKLIDQQNKEHQKLQQQQEKEHNQAKQKNYSDQQNQQMEQKHQQQTQQLEQKHQQQTQKLQTRQAPAPKPNSSKPKQ